MAKGEKKVHIRIAVAIDDTGLWSAAGNSAYENDEDATQGALDYLPLESSERRSIVWVEAEVPVPSSEESDDEGEESDVVVVKGRDVGSRT